MSGAQSNDKPLEDIKTDLDELLSQELTVRRQILHTLFEEGRVDFKIFKMMLKGFRDPETIDEIYNMYDAITFGYAPQPPNLELASNQFIWAVGLAFVINNPSMMERWKGFKEIPPDEIEPETFEKSLLWKQLKGSVRAKKELLMNINIANSITQRTDTKIKWGKPGRGTHFLYQKNEIYVDMLEALMEGFIHYRAKVATEISRGCLSKFFPLGLDKLGQEIRVLKDKQEKQKNKLSPKDYKSLRMKHFEWQMKYQFYQAVEGNMLFENSRSLKSFFYQDMAKSLNHYAVTMMHVNDAEHQEHKEKNGFFTELFENPGEEFVHLCRVIELMFHADNNLIKSGVNGWHEIGLSPEKIRSSENMGKTRYSLSDFEMLVGLLRDTSEGVQYLKPEPEEILNGREFFDSQAKGYNKGRNILTEIIWNSFGEHLMRNMLRQFEEVLDEEMRQKAEIEKMMEEMRKKQDEEILALLEQVQNSIGKASQKLESEIKKGRPKP